MPIFNNALAGAAGSGGAAAGYEITRSLRFNSGDSSYLNRTPSSAGNQKTFTFSCWAKISKLDAEKNIFVGSNNWFRFESSNEIYYWHSGSTQVHTDAKFRDPSAWYHLVLAVDTTQSTASNRVKIYVNGVQQDLSGTQPSQDATLGFNGTYAHYLGSQGTSGSNAFNGYLAEIHLVDGQQLDASDFGEPDADTDVWNPKAYSGTYGTNGFYLDFSDNSSKDALGFDANVEGTRYSAFVTGFQSSYPPANMFDGSTSTFTLGSNNGGIMTFTPATPIPYAAASGGVELYLHPGTQPDRFRINGGSWVNQTNQATGGWQTISTGDGSITKIEFQDQSTAEAVVYAIRVNGTILTDPSGANDWDVTNITASATKWSSYLIPQSPATFDSSYPASEAFDGSIAANQEARLNAGSYADRYIDFIPTGGIAFSNQIEMYVGASNFEYSYNGGSNVAVTAGAWHTVASGGGTLTSIRIQRTQTLTHTWRALRVDGTILVDGDPAGTDSLIDTPTNYTADSGNNGGNYATWNPLDVKTTIALSNGNLDLVGSSDGRTRATLAMPSGKWYWEITAGAVPASNHVGVWATNVQLSNDTYRAIYRGDGYWIVGGSAGSGWSSVTTGDIIGITFDASTRETKFYKNNSLLGTKTAPVLPSGSEYTPAVILAGSNSSLQANFGQRPFAFPPPTGFKSLCTQNLDDPLIADGSTAFDITTFSNTAQTSGSFTTTITPDLIITKRRDSTSNWVWQDIVRGYGDNKNLHSNLSVAETSTGNITGVSGTTVSYGTNSNMYNSQVAWYWDGGTSTVSNTDGSITSNVRANTSAGFSIVTWTGNSGTVGHGLNATPGLIIAKIRNTSSAWPVQHSYDTSQFLTLDTPDQASSDTTRFGAAPTSSVFSVGSWWNSTSDGVAYCFAPVEGYSAFGSYTGNGDTSGDGPFVYTGFRPRWVMVKSSSNSGEHWLILDTKRDPHNLSDATIYANLTNFEVEASALGIDILSNGFKCIGTNAGINASGYTYIYAAFAENPFKTARAR